MEWISVKDRLPQHLFTVIVCDIDGNVFSAFFDNKAMQWQDFDSDGLCEYENITHWMKMPNPPTNSRE